MSRVKIELTPETEAVKVVVTNDEWADDDPAYTQNADGWPRILSRLKPLLETGKTFKPHQASYIQLSKSPILTGISQKHRSALPFTKLPIYSITKFPPPPPPISFNYHSKGVSRGHPRPTAFNQAPKHVESALNCVQSGYFCL